MISYIKTIRDYLNVFTDIKILRIVSDEIGETITIFKKQHFEKECTFSFEVNTMFRYSIKVGKGCLFIKAPEEK